MEGILLPILDRAKTLREKMHDVVAHIESGVRTLNQMQLRELVRMLGALAMEVTSLKIAAEALLEEEESDQSQRTQPSAETDEATTETIAPVA